MWQKDHRKSKKACVPRKKFEEEPEYYSFDDNYDMGITIMNRIMIN